MISVVGISDGIAPGGVPLLAEATVVAGSARLLALTGRARLRAARSIVLSGDLVGSLDALAAAHDAGEHVCVLASGDPGWFGIVRVLAQRFGSDVLDVHPSPSSVSLAFARLGLPWDDAVVVSAHGRPARQAACVAARALKVAVLTGPGATAKELGPLLIDLGASHEHAAVCERLGTDDERVSHTDLAGLGAQTWDDLAVVVLWSGSGIAPDKSLTWGRPEDRFLHRASMITKSETRAVVVGLLDLPGPAEAPAVLWDLGAGSGSVGIECAHLAPWLEVVAVEQDAAAAASCRANAAHHGVALRVINDSAPGALETLPDPERVFVGGGGVDVLRAAWRRVRPGGTVVATYAAMDRALAGADLLGHVTQLSTARGHRLPDGGWRLAGSNPTFICWGTR